MGPSRSSIFGLRLAAALVLPLLSTPSALAQSRDVVVAAKAGTTTLRGVVRGEGDVTYRIRLGVGDRLEVALKPSNPSTYMNVTAPGANEAMHVGAVAGNSFATTATVAGPHAVQVYLMRNAARRGERSSFSLTVKVVKAGAAPSPDFADGLSGGPDFWQVQGVAANDRLNIRRSPSAKAPIAIRVRNGTTLRNLGCRMEGQQRWCRVETQAAVQGWALGRFLREGAPPQSRPGDALVPGTNYHATGQVACAIRRQPQIVMCTFGVTRGAPGVATVFITRPDGTQRVLGFDKGAVRSLQAAQSVRVMRAGDSTLVDIDGGAEGYTIPDAVISGG